MKISSLKKVAVVIVIGALYQSTASADHGGSFHQNWYLSVPSSNPFGSYTVSYASGNGSSVFLEEKFNAGQYQTVADASFSTSTTFTAKPAGTYTYRMRFELCAFTCFTNYTNPQSIVVSNPNPPPPPPPPSVADSIQDQANYLWEARSGDFDQDGNVDFLLERLSSGSVDGSLLTTILEGNGTGVTAKSPTSAELQNARTFPLTTQIALDAVDLNVDGYLDLFVSGLDALGSSSFPADELIVFASGVEPQTTPAAIKFFDQTVVDYLGAIREGFADPDYFIDNANVSFRPVFAIFLNCGGNYFFQPFGFLGCQFEVRLVGFVFQIIGTSYPIQSLTTVARLTEIADIGSWQNGEQNHFKILSDAFFEIFGTRMFGFKLDGTRSHTNYKRGSDTEADEIEELGVILIGQFETLIGENDNPQSQPILFRHVYDVDNTICLTNQDTPVVKVRTLGPGAISTDIEVISAAKCNMANVNCWKRKRPAPRSIFSPNRGRTVYDSEPSELQGFLLQTNPIVTWLPNIEEDGRLLVNETRPGHIFHDDAAVDGCADSLSFGAINGPSPGSRCSYVFRETDLSMAPASPAIKISTHGEGWNEAPYNFVNERLGVLIFEQVDRWIQERLADPGVCSADPPP